ncbi:MAG: type IX secretion system protein PorQ [Bacteroidetes bacterium]|nr:type IX secretion system protein PorQ [Bacteroidota bacterium]
MQKKATILFLFISSLLSAQTGGSDVFPSLTFPISARSASMGGISIAVSDNDVNQLLQSPSLLNASMSKKLSFSFVNYYSDVKFGNFVYAQKIDKLKGSVGAYLQFLDYGKFTRADETGAEIGQFYASDYVLGLSYSKPFADTSFVIGASVKSIYGVYESYTSFANAVDIGATYTNTKHLFGATILFKNWGKQWVGFTPNSEEKLPFEVQIGVSKKLAKAPFRFSLIGQQLQKWDLLYNDPANPAPTVDPLTGEKIEKSKFSVFGSKLMSHVVFSTEILLTKNFFVNIGYNHLRRQELKLDTRPGMAGFSFGAGIKISKFNISYGRAQYHLVGASNHISLTTRLSDFGGKKENPN